MGWFGWSKHKTVSFNDNTEESGGRMIARSGQSHNKMSKNHYHVFTNPEEGHKDHKSEYEVGTQLAEVKENDVKSVNTTTNVGGAFRTFMGWD